MQNIKPKLRGVSHQAAFFLFIVLSVTLLWNVRFLDHFGFILIYCVTLVSLFGISALYHRVNWGESARQWMRRLDHSAIFLLIAGTSTPMAVFTLGQSSGYRFLSIVWSGAAFGVLLSLFWVKAPKWIPAVLAVILGWLAVPYFAEMNKAIKLSGSLLLVCGGLAYTGGAIVYTLKRPYARARVFGYHEIFHLFVILGALLHFILIFSLTL